MDLAVVTPQLNSYGGSEIYLLECLKRWHNSAKITLYTPKFNRKLFREFGIGDTINVIKLPAASTPDRRFRLFHEVAVMPRIWEQKIRSHDLYFLYLFPTQMIQRRPSVWFAAEPLRMLYDLRQFSKDGRKEIDVHFYPKLQYDKIRVSDLDILQHIIEKLDSGAEFDRLVTNSRAMGQYLESIYNRKPDEIAYPGIHLPEDISPPSSYDKVLFIGRLWRHKRIDLIIKAMALTLSTNKLIIAGDGPEKERLRKLAEQLGMKDTVLFPGDVTMKERDRLYRECTCCVYTPVREPFGMVPLEAAAAGRPVVATSGGGYSEILNKDSAIFVPAYQGAIAKGIHKLMSNPQLAIKMGMAGRKIAEEYTWDRTAATLMRVFKETIRGPVGRKYGIEKVPGRVSKPLLGAHYYPWYRYGKNPVQWNENTDFAGVTDFPVGGPYTSNHMKIIKRHLKIAKQSGLDFLVVNLHVDFRGLSSYEVSVAKKIFREVERNGHNMKLAILLAIYTEEPEVAVKAIRRVKKEFLNTPSYMRFKRKAVLWYLLHDPLQGLLFSRFLEFKRMHRGIHPIATGGIAYNKLLPGLLRDFFSGWNFYSPLQVGLKKDWETIWSETYRDFIEDRGTVRTFTISPGYDDSHLTNESRKKSRFRHISRMGLKTYERMQGAALKLKPSPDYVVITSFNEFQENTHIEPSERFGDRYIRSTHNFKERLCGNNF
ncbi:glycosyltransferase [Thermodesulfobacteriota bacterium]